MTAKRRSIRANCFRDDHCHLVLRPASCVFAGPKSYVLCPMSYVLCPRTSMHGTADTPSLHPCVISPARDRPALHTADFSRQGRLVVPGDPALAPIHIYAFEARSSAKVSRFMIGSRTICFAFYEILQSHTSLANYSRTSDIGLRTSSFEDAGRRTQDAGRKCLYNSSSLRN